MTTELIRAFVVPCTFLPGCGYPEVSDACTIQITGLNNLTVSSGTNTGTFGFPATATSGTIGAPLTTLTPDRAWGGNEGPLVWRAVGDALAGGGSATYPFAGTKPFAVPMTTAVASSLDPKTGGTAWPPVNVLNFAGLNGLTVTIQDLKANTLQTLTVNLPPFNTHSPYSLHAPTPNGECDHADGATPATSHTDWATNSTYAAAPSYYMCLRNRLLATPRSRAVMIQAGDISRGVEAATDLRVIAALTNVPASMFQPHPGYQLNSLNGQSGSHAQNLRFADGTSVCFAPGATLADNLTPANASYGLNRLASSMAYPTSPTTLITAIDWRNGATKVYYNYFAAPPCSAPTGSAYAAMPTVVNGTLSSTTVNGDWDTGPGFSPDGAQINLPDAGTSFTPASAYFSLTGGQPGAATQRTPGALVPSPVIFGSLPAAVNPSQPAQSQPWRTLLFCPYPAAGPSHPGFGNASASPPVVPDHLVLDNFWMPVVEPYAIATCLTTAGKINLNDQIVPFTYLHRNTALRALLAGIRIPAIPAGDAATYKSSGTALTTIWNTIDPDATMAQIENKFANSSADAYLSESEICTVPLVPQGQNAGSVAATQTALTSFWNNNGAAGQLTGDNLRELPYAQLYGRLTTRSNSYTVHVRVQVLKKLPGDPQQNVWKEGADLILGDWRGSYEIERYLETAAPAPAAGTPLGPYKFRIVSARRFAP